MDNPIHMFARENKQTIVFSWFDEGSKQVQTHTSQNTDAHMNAKIIFCMFLSSKRTLFHLRFDRNAIPGQKNVKSEKKLLPGMPRLKILSE